jgi:FtsZ-binding cell division protein ZapB
MASEKTQALVTHFEALAELKEYFQHRFEQLLDTAGYKWDSFELERVDEFGITLGTEYYSCGDKDYEERRFPLSDLDVDVDELNRRENERLTKEKAAYDAREAVRKAQQAAQIERRDREEYARLKAKYGHDDQNPT